MTARHIDAEDFLRVLRNAVLICGPTFTNQEWRYRVKERPGNASAEREGIEIVVVIESEDLVWGHTVYRRRAR